MSFSLSQLDGATLPSDLDGLWWLLTFTAIGTLVLFIMYVRAPRPEGRRYDGV